MLIVEGGVVIFRCYVRYVMNVLITENISFNIIKWRIFPKSVTFSLFLLFISITYSSQIMRYIYQIMSLLTVWPGRSSKVVCRNIFSPPSSCPRYLSSNRYFISHECINRNRRSWTTRMCVRSIRYSTRVHPSTWGDWWIFLLVILHLNDLTSSDHHHHQLQLLFHLMLGECH